MAFCSISMFLGIVDVAMHACFGNVLLLFCVDSNVYSVKDRLLWENLMRSSTD